MEQLDGGGEDATDARTRIAQHVLQHAAAVVVALRPVAAQESLPPRQHEDTFVDLVVCWGRARIESRTRLQLMAQSANQGQRSNAPFGLKWSAL